MKHAVVGSLALFLALIHQASAQLPSVRTSEAIPRDVREIYDRGLSYLVSTQSDDGSWTGRGGETGPGVTGMHCPQPG